MTNGSDDPDRIFVRSRWGDRRYVYNPYNPIGRALIAGTVLVAVVALFLLHRSSVRGASGDWSEKELRKAVTAATAELASDAEFGPGSVGYEEILQSGIAEAAHRAERGLTVALASAPPTSALVEGGPERADYTVRADGTDTQLCLDVHALKRRMAMGYDSVTISVGEGACPAS